MVTLRRGKKKTTAAGRKAIDKAAAAGASTLAATAGVARGGSTTTNANGNTNGADVEPTVALGRLLAFLTRAHLLAATPPEEPIAPVLDALLTTGCGGPRDRATAPGELLAQLTAASRKRVCGVIFSADEIAYSCRNCQVDGTCVICKDCFMNGDHAGHDVYFQRTTAGSSCDCGDPHAWKTSGFCARHPGADDGELDSRAKRAGLPKGLAMYAPMVIDAVVEHVHQVFLGLEFGFELATALECFTRDIPPHLLGELAQERRQSANVVTISTSPSTPSASTGSTTVAPARRSSRRLGAATEMESKSSADDNATIPTNGEPAPDGPVAFSIRLHNDDVHSLGEVMNYICVALDCSKFTARSAVNGADRLGDAVVAKLSLLRCAQPVGELVRRTLNTSVTPIWWERQMEQISGILEWLRSITTASDGLCDIVSEALLKKRPRRLSLPKPVSDCFTRATSISSFLKHRSLRVNHAARDVITRIVGESSDLNRCLSRMEAFSAKMFDFGDLAVSTPLENDCENVFIAHFLKAVAQTRACGQHQSIRGACDAVTKNYFTTEQHPASALSLMVRWDCALRKKTARVSHTLLREHMVQNAFRRHMLEEYVRSYQSMTASYLRGLGNSTDSIFDFAVQFLTVPHLVKDYTREEVEKDQDKPYIVFELLQALERILSTATDPTGSQTINVDHPALSSQKYKHCIDDLEYVLNIGSIPNQLVCDRRNLQLWISCLRYLQNGDLQRRRGIHQSHVEYESDSWLSMFNLGIRVHSIFPVSWNGFSLEELRKTDMGITDLFGTIVEAVVQSSRSLTSALDVKSLPSLKDLTQGTWAPRVDSDITAYKFNIASSPTSFHVPLHRFLAASIRHTVIHHTWLAQLVESNGFLEVCGLSQLSLDDRKDIVELPLRSLAMSSQIQSNLWRRNGEENMMAQLFNYSALPYCLHYRDADVFLLQIGILLLGPEYILAQLVDRLQLGAFFKHQNIYTYTTAEEGIDEPQMLQLVEELLRLIIVLGTSLPSATGEEYENMFLEEEMLQHLCAKPSTFSKLLDTAILPTGQEDVSVSRLESVLSRVAEFSPPSGLDPGRYELKDGLLEAYNPYYLHLNREAHELARDQWTSYRKTARKQNRTSPHPPLKSMPRPLPFLQPVQEVLLCDGTISIVRTILWKVLHAESSDGASSSISDAVISTSLHLLVYAVYAAENDGGQNSAFWDRLTENDTSKGQSSQQSSVLSMLYELSRRDDSSLDDEQAGTLEWLVSVLKRIPTCMKLIDEFSAPRSVHPPADSSGPAQTGQPMTLEQRKAEARKRALDAMARQQAAFQAMMSNIEGDDSGADDEGVNDGSIVVREGDFSVEEASRKRRASAESFDEELKRPRIEAENENCYKCILCHDTATQGEMGLAAYVHQSTVLSGAFRPEPEEALHTDGEQIRNKIKGLIEKMDLCSGGPSASADSDAPALQAFAAQFPEWYLEDRLDEELLLDSAFSLDTNGPLRHGPPRPGTRRQAVLDADMLNSDDELDVLEGALDLRDEQRFGQRIVFGQDRRDQDPAQRRVARRRNGDVPVMEGDSDEDEHFHEHFHDHLGHHHHDHDHHHHQHNHAAHSANRESVPLYLTPCGLHIRTCQHAVHIHCLERYIGSLHEKAIRGEDFDGCQAIDPDSAMTQFLCPLCKVLCNFLIPASDPTSSRGESDQPQRIAIDDEGPRIWHTIVDRQLQIAGWCRTVLGRDGDYSSSEGDAHDLWRDYFEETLWEPHGSLEKGAPYLWSACAFSLASFLHVADDEYRNFSGSSTPFDPLTDRCPPPLEKEFASLIAISKFCRWSFSLLEHSEDAKVIWETSKRCCPINTETKREYRKFTKVLGSIDACLRGTILGLLVADTFTAFIVSCVIADSPSTIWQFIPVFSAADLLQRLHSEFFVQKSDERSLLQDKSSIVEELPQDAVVPQASQAEDSATNARRSNRKHQREVFKNSAQEDRMGELKRLSSGSNPDTKSFLRIIQRILESSDDEQLKPISEGDLQARLDRVKDANSLLVRRMKLFWRCFSDREKYQQQPQALSIPSISDIAETSDAVFDQVWRWCVDRLNSKNFLGIAKNGDKCEHAEGCGEAYIASMFVLRDITVKPRLIDLPIQYDELYGMMSGRKCARCEKAPCEPGLCLICGDFLCCGDSCCTRPFVNHGPPVGECTRHAAECGGGIGIVLLLDQCRVAIIGGSMAAHFPCPYVDAHGEEDIGLQRGRPLRLDMVRYRYLESLWLSQRIFAEVSRQRNQREPQFTINLSYL